MNGDKRVALIGYGLGGRAFHAPFIAATPGLRLAAIVTRDEERAAQARAAFPEARIVPGSDALFTDPSDIDAVVISTPNRTHVPLALEALAAGLNVVVDKPIATTSMEARRLVDEAERRGLMLTVYHNRRFDGDFLTLQRLVGEDALGDIYRLESRFERWRPNAKQTWRESGDLAEGGGILFDLGSHLVDQALVLFGPVTDVYAEIDRRRKEVEADDDVFVSLAHASGVRSHLTMSAVAAQEAARFRLLGSRAAYTKFGMDVQEDALRNGERPGTAGWGIEPRERWGTLGVGADLLRVPTEPGSYGMFYTGVAAALVDGEPPPVDPRDAAYGLEVIEAARTSAVEGKVVPMNARH